MTALQEIEKLLSGYRAWIEMTAPFLDRHNDALPICARPENGGCVLTDDSYTVHDLEESGPARQHNLIQALLAVNDLLYLASPIVERLFF
jgi:Domain of unknown function DUF1828